MKQQIIINVGVSGSGKTTWSTEQVKNNSRILRINRDDIRRVLVGSLDGYYHRKDLSTIEVMVSNTEAYLAVEALRRGFDIIFDSTHLRASYITEKIELMEHWAEALNREIEFKFKIFDLNHAETLKNRISNRDNLLKPEQLAYIDKQIQQFGNVMDYIEVQHKDKIL